MEAKAVAHGRNDRVFEGDPSLQARLDGFVHVRTRRIAAASVDGSAVRWGTIGADRDTLFEIGSITKGLTGILLADALHRHELGLHWRVDQVLPEAEGTPVGGVTLRELCTHTSGLPRLPPSTSLFARAVASGLWGANPYHGATPSGVVRLAVRQRLSRRGQYRYSNLGAAVVGEVLARTSGTDYATLLERRVFAPLGMQHSRVGRPRDAAPPGYSPSGRRQQPWILGGYAPAGGVVSTVMDMARLASALLTRRAPGATALDPLWWSPDRGRAIGMFWQITREPDGRHRIWHNGQTGGHAAMLTLRPEASRAAIVLLAVADVAAAERLARDVLDA